VDRLQANVAHIKPNWSIPRSRKPEEVIFLNTCVIGVIYLKFKFNINYGFARIWKVKYFKNSNIVKLQFFIYLKMKF